MSPHLSRKRRDGVEEELRRRGQKGAKVGRDGTVENAHDLGNVALYELGKVAGVRRKDLKPK
jgi:hypothetical protein